MKPTIIEVYAKDKDGEQVTLTKLILGNITIGKLIDKWKRQGLTVYNVRIVKELDMPPDELLFYLNENFEPPF